MVRIGSILGAGLLCGLLLAPTGGMAWAAGTSPTMDPGHRLNVNTASAEELVRLPGIGPALAQAIIKYRAQEPFAKPEDLRKVKGIGDKLYERIKDQVTVGNEAAAPKGRGS